VAIIPCGHRVLVIQTDYDDHDDVFKSAKSAGIEIVKDSKTRYQASVDDGVIVSVGLTAWKDFGGDWAKPGDKVVFAKNAGKTIKDPQDENTNYVVLNDEDIIAVIKE
jgi:co-chaperonin GroES (HSP10)